MEENRKTQGVVFLDASVLLAAALSPAGGSFRVLSEASFRSFVLITCRYAFREAERAIERKYPNKIAELYYLASLVLFVDDASESEVKRLIDVIDIKDAPILAAALRARAQVLLTFDQRHFIENERLQTLKLLIRIATPGSFIQEHFL